MAETPLPDRSMAGAAALFGETQEDYRRRKALLQAEALERRQQELREQSSPLNTPSDRIRIWERLHQLQMPRSPTHRLLSVIATDTGLSAEEVLSEQHDRAVAKAAAPAR